VGKVYASLLSAFKGARDPADILSIMIAQTVRKRSPNASAISLTVAYLAGVALANRVAAAAV
jgi:hypothetical protein